MVEKRASICGLIKRVLAGSSRPLTVEEIMVNATQSWGRPFPDNPYEPPALIYKLACTLCNAEVDEDDKRIVISSGSDEEYIIMLSPDLPIHILNQVSDQIKHIKLHRKKEK